MRELKVVDYSYGKKSSDDVITSLPFTENLKECKTIQQANVVIGAYVNENIKDIKKVEESLKEKQDVLKPGESIGNIVVDNIKCKNIFDGFLDEGTYDVNGEKIVASNYYRNVNIIEVKPNTTYTMSIDGVAQKYVLYFYNASKNFIKSGDVTTGTFTTPANCYYVNFRCYSTDFTTNFKTLKIQIEKGSVATEFVEHIDFGIKDTGLIAFENYGYYRKYGKIVFIELMKYGLSLTLNAGESIELGYLPSNCRPRWLFVVPAIISLTGGSYSFNCTLNINYTTGLVTIKNQGTTNLTVYGLCCNTSYMVDNEETLDVSTASEVSTTSLE